jgi:hypothetical protein
MARHLAHLRESDGAINLFRRVLKGGHCCYPAIADDPWLDPARARPEFRKLLRQESTIAFP